MPAIGAAPLYTVAHSVPGSCRKLAQGKDRQQGLSAARQTSARQGKIQDTVDGGAFESEDIGEGLAHHEDDR